MYAAIDGVKTPKMESDEVYKVATGTSVRVSASQNVTVTGSAFWGGIAQALSPKYGVVKTPPGFEALANAFKKK